ncbi:response regulator transcription factor [Spirosoma oryzicola]|uniref:response regulator transcription factor n=1 Tax=Spirosoma oryzicola TaxID=2898794 RepID=UPI001E62BC3A|nr:response regulator transcription factor [Spirosoma oryzicola]UHG93948.1 response regulator transcription factor [Spirosoma oryzicola]
MIRISIFDDNNSLRETLALIFDTTDDLITVGQYADALDVVANVRYNQPDVILMDIDMPGRTGIEAVQLIRKSLPEGRVPKILMLTVFDDVERIFAAISAGAVGYLLKKTPADKIIDAIREVMSGGAAMTPSIALKVLGAFQQSGTASPDSFLLTDKEKEVLHRLVEGDSYKLIAHHCHISMGTVRTHIVNIYEKLHVNSKSEAVAKALKTGLFK